MTKTKLTTEVTELPGQARRDLAAIAQEAKDNPGTWRLVNDAAPTRNRSARAAAHLRKYGIEVAVRENRVYVRAAAEK
jgi:hypothetical protein